LKIGTLHDNDNNSRVVSNSVVNFSISKLEYGKKRKRKKTENLNHEYALIKRIKKVGWDIILIIVRSSPTVFCALR